MEHHNFPHTYLHLVLGPFQNHLNLLLVLPSSTACFCTTLTLPSTTTRQLLPNFIQAACTSVAFNVPFLHLLSLEPTARKSSGLPQALQSHFCTNSLLQRILSNSRASSRRFLSYIIGSLSFFSGNHRQRKHFSAHPPQFTKAGLDPKLFAEQVKWIKQCGEIVHTIQTLGVFGSIPVFFVIRFFKSFIFSLTYTTSIVY